MRQRLSVLLVLMLAVRSLLPAGFMLQPSAAGDGSLAIVICTGHGPQTISLDPEGQPAKSPAQKSDAGICPFATAGSVALAGADAPLLATTVNYAGVDFALPDAPLLVKPHPRATSSRGPPSFLI